MNQGSSDGFFIFFASSHLWNVPVVPEPCQDKQRRVIVAGLRFKRWFVQISDRSFIFCHLQFLVSSAVRRLQFHSQKPPINAPGGRWRVLKSDFCILQPSRHYFCFC